ncbi:MAG: beta-glucosidase BglX [Phaeodactylibacter sp.]|nr:beta-glucosidase BglX [Phaeodactylibacter sp.]MCB9290386.1 beta-glucosidase BglX [Lewinellaceae bacterium]
MIRTFNISLAVLLFSHLAWSQMETGKYLYAQHQYNGDTLNYRVLYPSDFDESRRYPLVLFLHGRGESGSDNETQLVHGGKLFLESIDKYPAVILFPQCPKTDYWANIERIQKDDGSLQFNFPDNRPPNPSLAAVMDLVSQELAKPYIDENRFYVTGLSMGGMGTWELLWRMPEKIAAAAPICGGGTPERASAMADVPIWAFHGMKDDVVQPRNSIRMLKAIQREGGPAKITLFPGANHNSWDPAFAEPEYLPWMFSKYRGESYSLFVDSLMSEMTLEEKIGQLNLVTQGGAVTGSVISKDVEQKIRDGNVGGIFGSRSASKMRKIQEIAVNESRRGIPLLTGMDVIHGHQTIFPIPLGMSCTWDPELIGETARTAAREATADGIMWNFSPMVDICRDPRWGRIAESSGEDPFLGSRIAAAMVRGYQQDDLADPTTMLACVKHFAAYGAPEGGRDYATVDMSRVRLHNEYLPPYKAAVDAGVGSVMTAFNVVDYVPASANEYLFQTVLRDKWGFDGFVVTDYTAVEELADHGLGNLQEVSALALKAGIDMDMVSEGLVGTLKKSLEEGKVTEAMIDHACQRILIAKERLGLFEDPYRYFDESRAPKEILSEKNRAFSREVAGKSAVLLKNEGNVLPLSKSAKIALIGPLADSRRNMMGTWSVSGDHSKSVTVREGLEALLGKEGSIRYAKGANISDDPEFARRVNTFGEEIVIDKRSPEEMIAEAVEIARSSDVIAAVMGEAADMSGESSSMAHIGLQPSQVRLLKALKETGKPIVLVLFNGRPMTLPWEDENMDAILEVWHPGIEAGYAVADLLFGDVNPSGKLTASFPVAVGQIPVYHSMLNTGRPYNGEENRKFLSNYLDIPNEPLYPFGYGLSYTQFEYGKPALSHTEMTKGGKVTLSVTVKNTGKRAGSEIVQLYIRDVVGSISRPVKELKGFKKIMLEPGEEKMVRFPIDESLLQFCNSELEWVVEPGEFRAFVGPNSRDVQGLSFEYK